MPDVSALLDAATAPTPSTSVTEVKQESIAAAAEAKRVGLGGTPTATAPMPQITPTQAYEAAVTQDTGAGRATQSPEVAELGSATPGELRDRYGRDAAEKLILQRLSGLRSYTTDQTGNRNGDSIAYDIGSGVGLGLANSVGGIAALTAGAVNSRAGLLLSQGLNSLNEAVQGTQSQTLQDRRRSQGVQNQLNYRDNAAQMEEERRAGTGNLLSGIRRVGRDVLDSVGNAVSDPTTLSDGVAQGVGSLLAAGPVGKGISLGAGLAERAVPTLAARLAATPTTAAGRLLSQALPGSTSLGIGAMEAGGGYTGTVTEAYKALQARTDLTEDQKVEMANRAGLRAAAVTAPLAIGAGGLVSRFEGAPLHVPSVRGALGNMARETLEEGIQGGTGQAAQNLALQAEVDPSRSLSEGVGEQIGTGALYGLGTAGVLQAPGAATVGIRGAANAAGSAVGNVLDQRAAGVRAANDAASPANDAVVAAAGTKIAEAAPQVEAVVQDAAQQVAASPTATPESTAAFQHLADKLIEVSQFNPEHFDNPAFPAPVREALGASTNRVEAIQRLAQVIDKSAPDSMDAMIAGHQMMGLIQQYESVVDSDPAALEAIPQGHPADDLVEQFNKLIPQIQANPAIHRALVKLAEINNAQETQAHADAEKGIAADDQAAIQNVVGLAQTSPGKGSAKAVGEVLHHAEQGRIELTPDQKNSLLASKAILDAAEKASQEQKALGHTKPIAAVADQVMINRDPGMTKLSAVQHVEGVVKAIRAGNNSLAQTKLQNLHDFVQHMKNKVEAINTHFAKGGPKPSFQALNPQTHEWYASKDLFELHPNSAGSVEGAQRVAIEGERLAQIYNSLVQAFPKLGGKAFTPIALNQALMGSPKEVAADFKSGKRVRPALNQGASKPATSSPTTVAETKPAPEATQLKVDETPKTPEPEAEAKVEETKTQETSETTEAAKPKGMDAAYPKLVGSTDPESKITNWFKQAFKLPKEAKTHLMGEEAPLEAVMAALDKADHRELAGAYMAYLSKGKQLSKILDRRLQTYLDKAPKTGPFAGKRPMDQFLEGRDLNRFVTGKVLNLTEQDGDTLAYHQELKETAILAALQWALTADRRETTLDEKDVAGITGIAQDNLSHVEDLINKLSDGLPTVTAKRTLAQKITSFWGLDPDSSAPAGYTDGIPEAMASELIEAMVEAKMLTMVPVKITSYYGAPVGADPKTINMYKSAQEKDVKDPLLAAPSAIEQVVLVEPEDINYLGKPPKRVAEKQLRNPAVDNTVQQKDMIKREQRTPHYLNNHMIKLYQSLGLENLQQLFASGSLTGRELNKNHEDSLDGQNRSVAAAFLHLSGLVGEITTEAEKAGVDADRLPVHYDYNVNKVGRLQMLGRYNPQSTKLIREAILPTRVTLDLSDTSSNDYAKYALALGQMLGLKVHKQPLSRTIEQLNAKLTGDLKPALEMLQEHDADPTGKMDEGFVDAMKKGLGGDLSVMAMHALVDYARLQNTKDRSKFETSVYVEADGVTNGPVNAMVLLTDGPFTGDWIQRIAKGGLFFKGHGDDGARGPRTMNEQHSYTPGQGGDSNDMYQTTTDNLKTAFDRLISGIDDSRVTEQLNHLKDMMDLFLPDFELKDNQMVMKRGIAKNPLTITIYGSGVKGIASKVAGAMVEQLYERMSQVAQSWKDHPDATMAEAMFGQEGTDKASAEKKLARFVASYEALTTKVVANRKGKLSMGEAMSTRPQTNFDPKSFTIAPERMENFRDNVRHLFVAPLREAITETIGSPLMESAKLLQKTTQIQSLFQQHAFNTAVRALIEEKKKTNPRAESDGLSRDELNDILKDVFAKFPLIKTANQTFFIAGSQSTDVNTTEYSQSTQGHLGTPGFVYGPKDAGVSGIPTLVIGTGDGQMMQTLATMPGAPQRTLKIFDGVNIPLDMLEEYSRKANEAVSQSWQGNPMQAVAESFAASTPNFTTDYPKEMLASLGRTLGIKEPNPADVAAGIKLLQSQALMAGRSIEARHRVLTRVAHHVDQMASAGQPYANQGIQLKGTTPQELAEELNVLYREELAKLDAKPVVSREVPVGDTQTSLPITKAPQTPQAEAKPLTYGRLDKKSGARVLSPTAINKIAKNLGLSPSQQAIFDQIRRTKAANAYTVVHGSAEQLAAYAQGRGTTFINHSADMKVNGYIDPANKVIYLLKANRELLVHELVHAATFEKLQDYYANTGSFTEQEVAAVKRLEALMNQFRSMADENPEMTNVQGQIEAALHDGAKANALNEFMAWGLTNNKLAETLKSKTATPLGQLIADTFKAIKAFVFGRAKVDAPGKDMLSNLLFNTAILVRKQPTLQNRVNALAHHMSPSYGTDQRLSDLKERFNRKIVDYLKSEPTHQTRNTGIIRQAVTRAKTMADAAVNQGFSMTPQAQYTFTSIVTALATEAALDPNAMSMAQSLFTHVLKTMDRKDFMRDPNGTDPADEAQADAKYDMLVGDVLVQKDAQGRSSLLPVFLGLAMTNDEFRKVLAKQPLPKNVMQDWNTLDGVIENAGNIGIDALSQRLAGTSKSKDVQQALDALTDHMLEENENHEGIVEMLGSTTGGMLDRTNQFVIEGMNALADKGVAATEKLDAKFNNNATKLLARSTKLMASIVSETQAEAVAEMVTTSINKIDGFRPFRELVSDLIGRTYSNMHIYDMIKLFRSNISADRQQFREDLPTFIVAKFKTKPTTEEWTHLFHGMGKTDLAQLVAHHSKSDVLNLLKNPLMLQREINKLEATLRGMDGAYFSMVQAKAQQLAEHMTTGEYGTNLLRNAEAVSRLLGEPRVDPKRPNPDAKYIETVDQLTSLYAVRNQSQTVKDTMAKLVQDEPGGMDFVLSYLVGQRAEEMSKAQTGRARLNHYKGHIPSLNKEGVSLVVADAFRNSELLEKSYKKVGDYFGSPAEQSMGLMSYYFAPVSAKSTFNQGLIQNVRQTASGVEASTGFTDGMTAGRIADKESVEKISKVLHRAEGRSHATENLMPIFDDSGIPVAYERAIDPRQLAHLNRDTHLAKMIGVWRGRQIEEGKAQIYNQKLVDALHDMYRKDMTNSSSNKSQYVNLLDPKSFPNDPVLLDAVSLMSRDVRDYAAGVFNEEALYVRKDMLNDVAGYRSASIGDPWSGVSRWSPAKQENVKRMVLGVVGNDAYRYLVNGEKILQNAVSNVKLLIAVKSVIVPAANFVSNIYQMISRGVPIAHVMKAVPAKVAEIHTYTKSHLREMELEAELRAVEGNPTLARPLQAELDSIKDNHTRLSIWPLIQAGEFSSISDAGISRDEILLSEGRWQEYMERLTDKLPEGIQTMARYAMVTKDTALFQGLQKAMEYGDFIAKAVIYDDLVLRQKKPIRDALGRVTEEFVNYDRLPGRTRGALESNGLLWFYHFKIRSVKVALSIIRNNPVHALLANVLPTPMNGIGTPITDNLVAKGLEGSLGYSVGPSMAFGSMRLNPWWNLVN